MEGTSKKSGVRKQKEKETREETQEETKAKRHKKEGRRLNQDLMDQFPNSGPKSKRTVQLNYDMEQLGDKFENLGDVWTPQRGYELFSYHYKRRNIVEPICKPWVYNLGKLVMPNIFCR